MNWLKQWLHNRREARKQKLRSDIALLDGVGKVGGRLTEETLRQKKALQDKLAKLEAK